MIDARKLNDTIAGLEGEVEKIKGISKIVKDIDELRGRIISDNNTIEEAYSILVKANSNLQSAVERYNNSIENITKLIVDFKDDNKKMKLEYEEIVGLKLERCKSDLSMIIEDTSVKTLDTIETKSILVETLLNEQKIEGAKFMEKIKRQDIILIIITLLGLINIVIKFI